MSVTRLKRKHRKNIARANNETRKIKNLLRTPVLKNVDLDELKSKFGEATAPDVAAKSNVPPAHQEHQPGTQPTQAKATAKPEAQSDVSTPGAKAPETEAKAEAPKAEAPAESLFEKVSHAATDAVQAVKHAASDAVEAVTHNSVVEKVTDAVVHNSLVEKATGAVQEAAHNVVEGTRQLLDGEAKSPEANQATKANQTAGTGFDAAEAVTKPVTEDGQAGEHPKPEIAL